MVEVQERLKQIYEGYPVYDVDGEKVGEVTYVHFGVDQYVPAWRTNTVINVDSDLVSPEVLEMLPRDKMPHELRQQMLQQGFIRVNPGFLRSDRYVMADQIVALNGERVLLSDPKDSLITF